MSDNGNIVSPKEADITRRYLEQCFCDLSIQAEAHPNMFLYCRTEDIHNATLSHLHMWIVQHDIPFLYDAFVWVGIYLYKWIDLFGGVCVSIDKDSDVIRKL